MAAPTDTPSLPGAAGGTSGDRGKSKAALTRVLCPVALPRRCQSVQDTPAPEAAAAAPTAAAKNSNLKKISCKNLVGESL